MIIHESPKVVKPTNTKLLLYNFLFFSRMACYMLFLLLVCLFSNAIGHPTDQSEGRSAQGVGIGTGIGVGKIHIFLVAKLLFNFKCPSVR